ncbi:hypothetical protein LCGC14_1383860 [marine sediment metagenome]|uniref:Uncharacterized protein n=1 Tax=marine sediment metagenome TaxID=412755 RepID=A0A0F9KMR2_9ZZZZ
MFMSLKNSFSIQIINPTSGRKMSWSPIEDKPALIEYLKKIGKDTIFRIAGVNYAGNACMVTHKYCERMIWGKECFGRGIRI